MNQELNLARPTADDVAAAMATLVRPRGGYVGPQDALAAALELAPGALVEFRSVQLGAVGQKLLALRYLVCNGAVWRRYFAWKAPLEKLSAGASARAEELMDRIERHLAEVSAATKTKPDLGLDQVRAVVTKDLTSDAALEMFVRLEREPALREGLRAELDRRAHELLAAAPRDVDLLYLTTHDLSRQPATTVGEGDFRYLIVADKGEMGTRAVREAIAAGMTPVVVYSAEDDDGALQVREAEAAGGIAIPLSGTFRESYANPAQIAERVRQTFEEKFGEGALGELQRAALYPGYGPLAENSVAIQHFRKNGICFVGPMQDVVEQAGDKRKFRKLAEAIDPVAVTPGIVLEETEEATIIEAVRAGHAAGKFAFPGRIKAANGGGGRGQVVLETPELLPTAVRKVLAEIQSNGWDPGVMFEQNIPETTHLEVQVVADRFGNVRHFGMRDCTEQRASQKIQEEAPPALLRRYPGLEARVTAIAVEIARRVGYVGACTVELMFKDGKFYLLEMNTRIQVEHPVTEEAHRIRRDGKLVPLNLVQLQLHVARGRAIDFSQEDVVCVRVAREFRINAESYQACVKDPRDGKLGLFLPNGGVFDELSVPTTDEVLAALPAELKKDVAELGVRFDSGFEVGDRLINKDPTFGKLIISLAAKKEAKEREFELLRQVSIVVLGLTKIGGRQLTPAGKVVEGRAFETNIAGHVRHSNAGAPERHVGWVLGYLRDKHPAS